MPFQVLAVDFWNGNVASVQSFITAAGVTYPVLRNGGSLSTSSQYGIPYDNYVLVDAAGIVRYTSVNETYGALGRFNDTHLRAAIGQALLALPIGERTYASRRGLRAP